MWKYTNENRHIKTLKAKACMQQEYMSEMYKAKQRWS